MTILATVFFALTLLNLLLLAWQWWVAWRFPLHRRAATPAISPPVTLLKPLKGCDADTPECLRSWLAQDHAGPIQILFGVAAADDPVCGVVRELIAARPGCDAQLVVCGEPRRPNAKVSTLIQLQKLARHDLLIVSDADVRVPPDLVAQLAAAFHRQEIGLVSCLYRFANPVNAAMNWEAFATNADFWSQMLQAQSLKSLDFALGAVMAVRRPLLEDIGGFESLADYLADDYQLGNKIARQGGRAALSPVVVDCYSPPMNWRGVWAHQVRWARTIRICQPLPYLFSLVSNGTVWPLLCLLLPLGKKAVLAAVLCLGLRFTTALCFEKKMTGKVTPVSLLFVLIKDLLQVGIWALAFTGNRVNWRGEEFCILAGGKLKKI